MHFQHPPHAEIKLVTCTKGAVFDVAVDLRAGSPSFLKWHGEKLSEDVKDVMLDVRYSDVTFAKTVASTLRLEANETHYLLLLNIAALERITAGGVNPGIESVTKP